MSFEPVNQVLLADKKLRRVVLAIVLVFGVLGLAAIHLVGEYLQGIQELAKESPEEALQQFGQFLRVFLAIGSVSLLAISISIGRFSLRALQTNQFPPPGTRVIRDTTVEQGARARKTALLGLVLAAMLGAGSVLLPWQGWSIYLMLKADI